MNQPATLDDVGISDVTLVFSRTTLSRLISFTAVIAAGAMFFDYLARGMDNVRALPIIALTALLVGTIAAALAQYGDRIYVSPDGLLYYNRWLPRLVRSSRWIRWDEVVEVREIRRRILVLFSDDGRRVLVDAIGAYTIARREILRRTPHAVISGTLEREDRPRPGAAGDS